VRENFASNYKVCDQDENGGCPKYGVRETCARLRLPPDDHFVEENVIMRAAEFDT